MKHLVFLLVLIFSLSACSGFQHMHYRKVKKVPAKGFVEPVSISEKDFKEQEILVLVIDSSNQVKELPDEKCDSSLASGVNVRGYQFKPAIKKDVAKVIPVKNFVREKFPEKKKAYQDHRGDGSGLLIILLLFFGLGLLAVGGTIFVIGFYALSWLLIALGLVMILLGLLPFLGLMTFAMGGRHKGVPTPYKEG